MTLSKYLHRTLILASFLLTFLINANSQGIHFEKGLSWKQIVAMAKTSHKQIFMDCYATWCGPCKAMDADVFSQKAVGDVYNKQFICLRVQMDQTAKDNDTVRGQYQLAKNLENDFAVNAYPTFLFLDENGDPLHKVAGYRDAKQFIRLAADAENPAKQYYKVLKNFKPGKVDTTDAKGLVNAFAGSDAQLSYKLVADYLSRVPKKNLNTAEHVGWMQGYQTVPAVAPIIIDYVSGLLAKSSFTKMDADFIAEFSGQKVIQDIVISYLEKLNELQLGKPGNMELTVNFMRTPAIKKIGTAYVERLPKDSLSKKGSIEVVALFTSMPDERGFALFYNYPQEVDAIMGKKGYANVAAETAIRNAELEPVLNTAKESGVPPDFDALQKTITRRYNAHFAVRVATTGKIAWYRYLVNVKKDATYWPMLNTARIDQMEITRPDTEASVDADRFMNTVCYNELFLHDNNKEELIKAAKWMKNVVDRNQTNTYLIDTYAALLYKSGQVEEAIKRENICVRLSKGDPSYAKVVEKMKTGEKIWEDKTVTGR